MLPALWRKKSGGVRQQLEWTLAILVVWLVAFLILLLVWYTFGPENRGWTTAIYAAVIFVASLLTFKVAPYKPGSGSSEQPQSRPGA